METTKTEAVKPAAHPTKTVSEPRNFLAAFLLTLSFGIFGVNRFYTGDMTVAWIRFGLFVGGFLLTLAVFTAGIGMALLTAAQIWGLVDVFLVYHGKRVDGEGMPLAQTERDRKVAKVIYVLFVVALALFLLFFIFLVVMMLNGNVPFNSMESGGGGYQYPYHSPNTLPY